MQHLLQKSKAHWLLSICTTCFFNSQKHTGFYPYSPPAFSTAKSTLITIHMHHLLFNSQKHTDYYPYAPPAFQQSKAHWLLSICTTCFSTVKSTLVTIHMHHLLFQQSKAHWLLFICTTCFSTAKSTLVTIHMHHLHFKDPQRVFTCSARFPAPNISVQK
jgi:hypothetical protein